MTLVPDSVQGTPVHKHHLHASPHLRSPGYHTGTREIWAWESTLFEVKEAYHSQAALFSDPGLWKQVSAPDSQAALPSSTLQGRRKA